MASVALKGSRRHELPDAHLFLLCCAFLSSMGLPIRLVAYLDHDLLYDPLGMLHSQYHHACLVETLVVLFSFLEAEVKENNFYPLTLLYLDHLYLAEARGEDIF